MSDADFPTFSIIVPTFRRPDVVDRTLDALLATDYPEDRFEIVVVDDGDDARTREVVGAVQNSRVKFLTGPGRGAAAARNFGAKVATGDYLVFVDDDRILGPAVLASLHALLGPTSQLLRPEWLLHRLYRAVVSVHYLRGFRAGFAPPTGSHRQPVDSGPILGAANPESAP